MFCGCITYAVADEQQEIKTVIIEGVGKDVPSAAQNAAKNALTNVVGSFIDATQLLEKVTEIQDGVRSESSRINTNIKEYSQGSIKSFEILSSTQEGGLVKLMAKVSVRIEDFKSYIKKVVMGETAVEGESLFAQTATQTNQKENKAALLLDNVLIPIISGQVVEFSISTPKPFSYDIFHPNDTDYLSKKSAEALVAKFGSENIFIISVVASLAPAATHNINKILENISTKATVSEPIRNMGGMLLYEQSVSELFYPNKNGSLQSNDILVLVNNGKSEVKSKDSQTLATTKISSDIYLVTDVRAKIKSMPGLGRRLFEYDGVRSKNLIVSMLDSNDRVLQKESIKPGIDSVQSDIKAITHISDYTGLEINCDQNFLDTPWMMLMGSCGDESHRPIIVFEQRSFDIIVAIDPNALSKTKKIMVSLSE